MSKQTILIPRMKILLKIRFFFLIHQHISPKWFSIVTIIVYHEFKFFVIFMIDSGSDMNCIKKGIISIKYYEKSIERLFSINGSQMKIKYELNTAILDLHLRSICQKQSFSRFFIIFSFWDIVLIRSGINHDNHKKFKFMANNNSNLRKPFKRKRLIN